MTTTQVVTGKFLGAGKIDTAGANGFTVRKFWLDLTDNPQYPNTPEFQLTGDKVNLVNELQAGQIITVKYNLNGRKYTNPATLKSSVITSLNAWRIEIMNTVSAAAVAPRPAAGQPGSARPTPSLAPAPAAPAGFGQTNTDDDLPF